MRKRFAAGCLFALVILVGLVARARAENPAETPRLWPSEPPAGCPLPQSGDYAGLAFTGRHANYSKADTWYPSWGADGRLYSPFTDGSVNGVSSGSGGAKATVGHAIVEGDDPLSLKIIEPGVIKGATAPYGGRYPCASLHHNGVWYLGTYGLANAPYGLNWPILGPFAGFHVSTDNGKTWTPSPRSCEPSHAVFPEPEAFKGPVKIGAPHVVDFGKNMEHSPDGKMYMVGHGATEPDEQDRKANLSWITGDQIYLCRVTPSPESVNDASQYEYFAGNDSAGNPVWSKEFGKIQPILDWDNHCGCVTITYNAPLKRYLMCVTDGKNTQSRYDTYLVESERITGPWKLITYMKEFGTEAYFVNIPSKFIAADGRSFWLCYSANWYNVCTRKPVHPVNPPGGEYAMSLHEVRLTTADEAKSLPTIPAPPLTIENDTLTVTYDNAAGSFAVAKKPAGKAFVTGGRLEGAAAKASVAAANDAVFGVGKKIVVTQTDGSAASLELYDKLPFALVRTERHNGGKETLDVQKAVPAVFTLDLGKPAAELRTLGTGGLLAPDANPGSYLFLTCADPATRRGVVAGWLTQDRGSGVVFSGVKGGKVEFKAQIDYGHLRIPAGQNAKLETLAIGVFDDARLGEEAWADAVKKQYAIKLRKPDAVYCTWYAEGKGHGGAGNEKNTVELSKFIARELKPFGLGVIQIDDRWQDGPIVDGPARGFERSNPKGPYPHGMEPVARELEKDGVTFGLWWLPFGRNHGVAEYKDRQHWFAKWADGKVMRTKGFGGTCLDLTQPEVQKHLASIAKLYRDWGVKYYKMDGSWTGTATEQIYINDGYKDDNMSNVAPFHDPSKTQIEAYRDGWKLLRKNAGEDVFFSGCCISQNMRSINCMGLVDSMRVGPDFNHDGQGLKTGPLRASRLYFMNGRIWWNDPDPSKVRASADGCEADPSINGAVSLNQARLTTSWVSLSGQFFLVSDWLPNLPQERLEVLRRTLAHHDGTARPVDAFDRALPNTWLATDDASGVRRAVVGVFNFDGAPLEVKHTCAKLGLDAVKTYHAFDFWANTPLPDFKGEFKAVAEPAACRVIAVRAVEDHPVLLSTSRHVSQGILELKQEKWDAAGKTLSGTSKLVENDPYELRIAGLADGGKQWKLASVAVSPEDQAAGVTITAKPVVASEEGLVRVMINSKTGREVKWTIHF